MILWVRLRLDPRLLRVVDTTGQITARVGRTCRAKTGSEPFFEVSAFRAATLWGSVAGFDVGVFEDVAHGCLAGRGLGTFGGELE